MIKIPRKVVVALALIGTLFVGATAYGISQLKFDSIKNDLKSNTSPFQEMNNVIFDEKLAGEFANYEFQFILGEYHSLHKEYEQAVDCYEQAIKSAKASVGEKSFFTYIAYDSEARAEEKNGQYEEAYEHFKAALRALPDLEEYENSKWCTEAWLVYTSDDQTDPKQIPFYRKHLALTEKLQDAYTSKKDLVYAMSLLAKALDNDDKFSESDPIWKKMIAEAHIADYSKTALVRWIMEFAHHEGSAHNWAEADKAALEASTLAAQAHDDQLTAEVLEGKGQLSLDREQFEDANKIFLEALALEKKSNNKNGLRCAYDWLAEVARRQNDLKAREKYLTSGFAFAEKEWQKTYRLPSLALVCRLDNNIESAREYAKQWAILTEKKPKIGGFFFKKDLDDFLLLYPKLKIANLSLYKEGPPQRWGYSLNHKQLEQLLKTI